MLLVLVLLMADAARLDLKVEMVRSSLKHLWHLLEFGNACLFRVTWSTSMACTKSGLNGFNLEKRLQSEDSSNSKSSLQNLLPNVMP